MNIHKDNSQLAGKVEKPAMAVDSTTLIKEDATASRMPWPTGHFEHGVQSVSRPRFGFDV